MGMTDIGHRNKGPTKYYELGFTLLQNKAIAKDIELVLFWNKGIETALLLIKYKKRLMKDKISIVIDKKTNCRYVPNIVGFKIKEIEDIEYDWFKRR